MLRIFEPQIVRNFTDGFGGIENLVFCHINQFIVDEFLSGNSHFFFNEIAKIIRGKIKLFRKIMNHRKTYILRLFRSKIIVQQTFKFSDDSLIDVISGDKLTVVKPHTVIQEQFDIIYN